MASASPSGASRRRGGQCRSVVQRCRLHRVARRLDLAVELLHVVAGLRLFYGVPRMVPSCARAGIMGVVIAGGGVIAGDVVAVELPDGPQEPLDRV
jgi:hypothetical protein